MSSHKQRLEQLENRQAEKRIVVRYVDETPAEEIEALQKDPNTTLILVEYADDPTAEDSTK
jgi:hypothetical protein